MRHCGRCNGLGYISQYKHVMGGVCFACGGHARYAASVLEKHVMTPRKKKNRNAWSNSTIWCFAIDNSKNVKASFSIDIDDYHRANLKAETLLGDDAKNLKIVFGDTWETKDQAAKRHALHFTTNQQ